MKCFPEFCNSFIKPKWGRSGKYLGRSGDGPGLASAVVAVLWNCTLTSVY
jgi:hypothetical protein